MLAASRKFDIVFLDIQMEGTDGIETAKKLQERDEDSIPIFITGIREYVFQAFDVSAFHYLLKPEPKLCRTRNVEWAAGIAVAMLKAFLAVRFISLRELSFWAGHSLLYIGNEMIKMLARLLLNCLEPSLK